MSAKPQPPGFPRRLLDMTGRKVTCCRKLSNGFVSIPANTVLTVRRSTAWSILNLEGPACKCCGITPYVSHVNVRDLTLVAE